MHQEFDQHHWTNDEGSPTGGCTTGNGFTISWQNGPLGRDGDRLAPNGAFVEDIITAALGRLEYYQTTKFECVENVQAIHHLQSALEMLRQRTEKRESRQVEGTHEV